ncbi:hypothetical protein PMIN01_10178 [Paraphaeosphaeria minitans]|uniref:Uncharacterized protein n=1 Tax=Paraphaeosphaeria minitans TaxID=565426 RepID=A0A9P6KN69_9PLEO|nr:hypothetical protein PMIN01_10178 [Paraphaeosphaeria minitans]
MFHPRHTRIGPPPFPKLPPTPLHHPLQLPTYPPRQFLLLPGPVVLPPPLNIINQPPHPSLIPPMHELRKPHSPRHLPFHRLHRAKVQPLPPPSFRNSPVARVNGVASPRPRVRHVALAAVQDGVQQHAFDGGRGLHVADEEVG